MRHTFYCALSSFPFVYFYVVIGESFFLKYFLYFVQNLSPFFQGRGGGHVIGDFFFFLSFTLFRIFLRFFFGGGGGGGGGGDILYQIRGFIFFLFNVKWWDLKCWCFACAVAQLRDSVQNGGLLYVLFTALRASTLIEEAPTEADLGQERMREGLLGTHGSTFHSGPPHPIVADVTFLQLQTTSSTS